MNTENVWAEATPLSRAQAPNFGDVSSSALLSDAKLLGSSPDMNFGATHVETAIPEFDLFERTYWASTATTGDRYQPAGRRRAKRAQPAESQPTDSVDLLNKTRIELLARRYVEKEKFSNEEVARLAIVTERVRKLLPAVTVAEFEALEESLKASVEVSELMLTLKARLAALSERRG